MTRSLDELLGEGLLIAMDRDGARQLFANRELAELRRLLADHLPPPHTPAELAGAVSCLGQWASLEQLFGREDLVPDAARPALQQCLSRGRTLCDAAGLRVVLIRPDLVPHIAAALADLSAASVRAHWESSHTASADLICEAFEQVKDFYGRASRARASVVFAADH